MIEALARFVEELRRDGQAVSPAEILDAAAALDRVGLDRRGDVKFALRATLAKDRKACAVFDSAFDRFFTAPKIPVDGRGKGRPAARGERSRPEMVPGDGLRRTPNKKGRKDLPSDEPAERRRTRPWETAEPPKRREGRLRRVRLRAAKTDPRDPATQDLARPMTTDEERAIAREVPRLVEELRLRTSRRGAAASAGRPWLARALRANLAHGGVPFVIPARRPKRKQARVVLLVDVSFSVARAAGFFLLMAGAFLELGRGARVLAFVDRPVDVTDDVTRWTRGTLRGISGKRRPVRQAHRPGGGIVRGGVPFADLLEALPLNLDAPSDYGTALHALRDPRKRPRGRDAILLVLGDGRTNRFDPLPWALSDIARGVRAVLWLAPEPASRWGTADSALPAYAESIDVLVEASDLTGLARGLGELIRRL